MADQMIDDIYTRARRRILDGRKEPNDELLLAIQHSGEETRKELKQVKEMLTPKRNNKITGTAAVGGMGAGALVAQFIRQFVT